MPENSSKGLVILAGAGPGDAELITLKLQKRLAEADVILSDRLVNPEIIKQHAKKDAKVILVGKQGFNDASVTREKINELIVDFSTKGKKVLRLKGGDVAFFSNVFDELLTCKKNEIPFEIIPGITAASGASAYAGIPLTARNYAQGIQWLAYNPNAEFSTEKLAALANTSDTLVFYMAAKNLSMLATKLLKYSDVDKKIAVIEQATTIYQKVHISTLKKCSIEFQKINFSSPSLIIIGNVTELHDQFNWFNGVGDGSIFPDLDE